MRQPVLVTHQVKTPRWRSAPIRIAVLSDLHVVAPWTSLGYVSRVVDQVNALSPDLILLPGDFLAEWKLLGRRAAASEIVTVLARLEAPFGVHATLGNHDWKDCKLARATGWARNSVAEAFQASPVHFYPNTAHDLGGFWIAGVDSMRGPGSPHGDKSRNDLIAATSAIPPDANVILMAHEPDIWAVEQPDVALTVSGHTHGGQIVWGDWRPLTPSKFGSRYAHGLHWKDDRALVVSGGLGYTAVPVRLGVPPEITLVTLSGQA